MWTILAFLALAPIQLAMSHSGHGDSMSTLGALPEGQMLMYFHFKPGDLIWFLGWVPSSTGAMVGASIGLFLFAVFERWVSALKALMEAHWRSRANAVVLSRARFRAHRESFTSADLASETKSGAAPNVLAATVPQVESQTQAQSGTGLGGMGIAALRHGIRSSPPFVWKHDLLRGAMHTVHMAIGYALMLVIMTFNGAFFIAICVGLGVGEMLFGRFGTHQHVG